MTKKVHTKKVNPFWSNFKQKSQTMLQKLSKGFMLPIALLPIAGLFLGIGATIASPAITADDSFWRSFGTFLKMMGEIPFANLPVLFAISVAIAFTDDAGVAGLTALIGFLIFAVVIAALMGENTVQYNYIINYSVDGKNREVIIHLDRVLSGDIEGQLKTKLEEILKDASYSNFSFVGFSKKVTSFSLLFWKGNLALDEKLTWNTLGIGPTLNTGVFGGILVGGLVAYLYNRFHTFELPSYLSFFSGVKFVPIVVFFAVIPLAFLTMIIWPPIGLAFNAFGKVSGNLPFGIDSLIFGLIERSLIPFGLHHVFYAPLWWSGAGGSLADYSAIVTKVANPVTLTAMGDQTGFMAVLADGKLLIQDVWDAGLRLGRFQTGKFPFMMFGLPAAAAAMTLTVPKANRKAALGIYASAGATAFVTGITEPLEFSFLFVAPWLYYGIHVPLAGISFMLMNVLGVKIGMTFSGGVLDWIIYGIVPSFSRHDTRWWIVPIVGAVYAVIYFTLFYFLILRFNVKIPGRDAAEGEFRLFTKKDYRQAKGHELANESAKDKPSHMKETSKAQLILDALGGTKNIKSIDACASRLRVQVNDASKVDVDALKQLGASGVMISDTSIQAVYGGQSDIYKTEIRKILKEK